MNFKYVLILKEMILVEPKLKLFIWGELLLTFLSKFLTVFASLLFAAFISENTKQPNQLSEFLFIFGITIPFIYTFIQITQWTINYMSLLLSSLRNGYTLKFCDEALLKLMQLPNSYLGYKDHSILALQLNKKSDARSFIGLMFSHILPPILEFFIAFGLFIFLGLFQYSLILLLTLIGYLFLVLIVSRKIYKSSTNSIENNSNTTIYTMQVFEKAHIAKVFNTLNFLGNLMQEKTKEDSRIMVSHMKLLDKLISLQTFPLALMAIAFFLLSSYHLINNVILVSDFIIVNTAVVTALSQLRNLSYAFDGLFSIISNLTPHYEILTSYRKYIASDEYKNNLLENKFSNINKEIKQNGLLEIKDLQVDICDKKILNGINLNVDSNQKIFLTGRSGAGKSTLIKTLLNFYHYSFGNIIFKNEEIKEKNNLFSWVPQENESLTGSIKDNLLLGKSDASETDMWNALSLAHLDMKVKDIGGLNSLLEKNGSNLSGGEKQRLSIARAIISNRPIMLLDEPTSALDTINESNIIKELMELNLAAIICVHRVKAIPNGSMVAYMENGKIIEFGIKEDLLNLQGSFAKLFAAAGT